MIDDSLWVVKICYRERIVSIGNDANMTVLYQKDTANYVPAAAVIHRCQALSGFIGRKECADGLISLRLNPRAQLWFALKTVSLECGRG